MRRLIFFALLVTLLAAGCASPETAVDADPETGLETGATVTVYRAPT